MTGAVHKRLRRRAVRGRLLPLGRTASGVDTRQVQVRDLPPGQVGQSVCVGDDRALCVSSRLSPASVASVAHHLLECHEPELHDESWDLLVCSTATCAQARLWLAERRWTAEAAGL